MKLPETATASSVFPAFPATEPRHPIRVVAQRTGLTPATLRAWERRYGVVEPHRSEGGQRLYSDRDVERLTRLHRLAEAGRAISLVAGLADDEAEALLQEDQDRRRKAPTDSAVQGSGAGPAAARLVDAALGRVAALDGEGLEAALRRAAVTLGAHPFLEEVVGPLLHRVGVAWAQEKLGTAEEHLCTTVTERVLAWLSEPTQTDPGSPRIVVATLSGERHGLGARLVAAAAALEGWHVTHLGVDLPARDIAGAARTLGAAAVAVSLVNADTLPGAGKALAELRQGLPEGTAILLGGGAAPRLDAGALPPNAEVVTGLADLRRALGRFS
jgi:DNA-binding transcriptional MerR regulator/methylmalonyl-CoA mutase cobalamin-binding subunit